MPSRKFPSRSEIKYIFIVGMSTIEQVERLLADLHSDFSSSLNIRAIFPYLITNGLITREERDVLLKDCYTDDYKINQLMTWLPKKGPDVIEKLIKCLEESSEGTGHGALAKKVQSLKMLFPIDNKDKLPKFKGKFHFFIIIIN